MNYLLNNWRPIYSVVVAAALWVAIVATAACLYWAVLQW